MPNVIRLNSSLKVIVHPQMKWFCHHLLTLMSSFQTCMTFFFMQNTKEDNLKNVGNQRVLIPIDLHCTFCPYNRFQWELNLFGYQYSSKYLPLCFTEVSQSYRFGMTTWGRVNNDNLNFCIDCQFNKPCFLIMFLKTPLNYVTLSSWQLSKFSPQNCYFK